MDLSVIIVHYKTEKMTCDCIASVLSSDLKDYTAEVIVVDNASKDGSGEVIDHRYPMIKYIENSDNLGFAKANNIGMKYAEGDYILLLNSDTIVEKDTLAACLDRIKQDETIGALGCKVVLPDGSLDAACKRSFPTPASSLYHLMGLDKKFPKSKTFGEYNLTYLDADKTAEVDCLVGAFMLVPRKVIETVGMLDEDYFMYGEDIDWCYRIKHSGYRILYWPAVKIIHYKRASGLGKRNPRVVAAFYDSMKIFYKKHYQGQYNPLLKGLIYAGMSFLKHRALRKNK